MSNPDVETGARLPLQATGDQGDFGATDRGKRILFRLLGSLASAAAGAGFAFLARWVGDSNLTVAVLAAAAALLLFGFSWSLIRRDGAASPDGNPT